MCSCSLTAQKGENMDWVYVLVIVSVIPLVITVHEFGHYIMARIYGVKVLEFSVGIGPSLFSTYLGTGNIRYFHYLPLKEFANPPQSTIYSLRLFPLGGFVRLKGEEPDDQKAPELDSLYAQKPWKRFLIFAGGVLMNLLVGIVFLAVIKTGKFEKIGHYDVWDNVTYQYFQVTKVDELMNPDFIVGDEIIAINGIPVNTIQEFQEITDYFRQYEFEVDIYRNGEFRTVWMQIYIEDINLQTDLRYIQTNVVQNNFIHGLRFGLGMLWQVYSESTQMLIRMAIKPFKQEVVQVDPDERLIGPIGFTQTVYNLFLEHGWMVVVFVFPFFSFAVAYFNSLPIPMLDGGRMMFELYEIIFRRKVNNVVYEYSMIISMALLLVLAIYVSVKDIINLFV